jgi:hypothetical protein
LRASLNTAHVGIEVIRRLNNHMSEYISSS